jgi:hypothetical protein
MEMTCVCFVPRAKRDKLRRVLQSSDTGPIEWREKKDLFGSEFYFSGPARVVRATQSYIAAWLVRD